MNLFDSKELWYTGKTSKDLHAVLDGAKREVMLTAIDGYGMQKTVSGRQMAEKLLDILHFDRQAQEQAARLTFGAKGAEAEAQKMHGRDIDCVHAVKSDEIREQWDEPLITDEELESALFNEASKRLLDEVPEQVQVDFWLG